MFMEGISLHPSIAFCFISVSFYFAVVDIDFVLRQGFMYPRLASNLLCG